MRTVYRRDRVRFDQEFKDGPNALIPKDATWPKYIIKSPNGAQVQNGTGTLLEAGKYRAEWVAQTNIPVTTDGNKNWNIEWSFVDENNKFYSITENFQVLDDVEIEETSREQKYIALAGQPYLAKIQLPLKPFNLSLKIFTTSDPAPKFTFEKLELLERENPDSGLFSYEVQIDSLSDQGCNFTLLWVIQDASTSTPRFQYQVVEVVGLNTLSLIPEVRILIDKFQKIAGTYQAFEDSDIVSYLSQGIKLVNAQYPTTAWNFNYNSPIWYGGLDHFVIMGAAWYGLTAQHLLENDLAFNFNGLSTTLDVDRTGGIESALGRMDAHIKDKLPAVKYAVHRKATGSGLTGVRVFGRRPTFENVSYKIGTTNGANILDYFQNMGIFLP